MKSYQFLVFFSVILAIHLLVNYYIYSRGVAGLEASPKLQLAFKWTMLILTASYLLGRFLEKVWYNPIPITFHWIGAFWFAGMLYAVMALLFIDLVRVANAFLHFLPNAQSAAYLSLKNITSLVVISLVVLIVLIGHINAWSTKMNRSTLAINKSANGLKTLKIVAVSDIHLGTIIGPRKTSKLIESINKLSPDIVLLAGDVVDEDLRPVIEQDLGKNFMNLKSTYGTYAIMGNHEYIGGADAADKYMKAHNINILRDSVTLINNSFYIVGREDKDKDRFTGVKRLEVDSLLRNLNKELPIILLDHQPFNLQNVVKAGVDLQISGHTHHGQLWPMNYITQAIFEVSKGYKKIDNTNIWVSTGFGTWGPPVRIGNRPEILEITLNFK